MGWAGLDALVDDDGVGGLTYVSLLLGVCVWAALGSWVGLVWLGGWVGLDRVVCMVRWGGAW